MGWIIAIPLLLLVVAFVFEAGVAAIEAAIGMVRWFAGKTAPRKGPQCRTCGYGEAAGFEPHYWQGRKHCGCCGYPSE